MSEKIPHVYTAMAAVLNSLKADKDGKLPSNMGGGAYVTASSLSSAAKEQFVKNKLIFIPNEKVIHYDAFSVDQRSIKIAVSIEGSYRLISTEDGSEVTISGAGDGLASGTAVASNIASTNALKNALLRTFLVTEQSIEESSRQELSASEPEKPSVRKVKETKTQPASTGVKKLRDTIREKFIESGKFSVEDVNKVMKAKEKDFTGAALFEEVIRELDERA